MIYAGRPSRFQVPPRPSVVGDPERNGDRPRALAEQWLGFLELDGLAYRSRYDNGQICYALFDRVKASELTPSGWLDLAKHPEVVDALMNLYGAVFDTSPFV